jgi:hypothetical protein
MIIPIPILRGVEGSRFLLFNQLKTAITAKVRDTMNKGLNDWNTSGEIEFCGAAWL